MLPDWALGYHQSRNRYATQKEVMEIAKKMKEKDIERVISTGARIICEMAVRSVYEPERLEAIRRDFRK